MSLWLGAPLLALLLLVLATGKLTHHIYFDRSGLPDLDPFIRFELSTVGKVYDARGTVHGPRRPAAPRPVDRVKARRPGPETKVQ